MRIVVTCANILTSQRSSMGHPFAFTADANTLLPLVSFIKDPNQIVGIKRTYHFEVWSDRQDLNPRPHDPWGEPLSVRSTSLSYGPTFNKMIHFLHL